MTPKSRSALLILTFAAVLLLTQASLHGQRRVASPKEQFGFNIGDDYVLVDYKQYEAYLKKLDQESDRLTVLPIGKSSEGRTIYLGVITSPENGRRLDQFKDIARRLSRAEGLTDDQAIQQAQGFGVLGAQQINFSTTSI